MGERRAGGEWIPELDGLRVLMIFLVSWYHIWQQSWLTPVIGDYSLDFLLRSGYVWVDGTVLLSGFLLYRPYGRFMLSGGLLPDPGSFYRRRARKILPGYYFLLVATLLGICLPWGLYSSPQFLVKDLATHLTFTFPFFYDTYHLTNLGGACWTLAVEAQAYLLFPWIARASLKRPGRTAAILLVLCLGFRIWCLWSLTEYQMVVNQLINFLDLYVLGSMLAVLYERLAAQERRPRWTRWAATVLFLLALWGLGRMLRVQAASSVYTADRGLGGWIDRVLGMTRTGSGYPVIQRNQMVYRPIYGMLFGTLILAAPFSLLPLRKMLGNRITRFLAGISMNYYLVHQVVIVHMRRIGFPASESDTPNQAMEQPWQIRYTLLAFGLSLLAATAVTFLVEKPVQRLMDRKAEKKASAGAEDKDRTESGRESEHSREGENV